MKIKASVLILSSTLLAVSCSEGRKVRLRANDITGVSGLQTEEFVGLKEYVASETNAPRVPINGDYIKLNVEYSTPQSKQFVIDDEGEDLDCLYKYSNATLDQTMNVKGETYTMSETVSPTDPEYAGVPYIEAQKLKCDEEISELIHAKPPVVVDVVANHKSFKEFLGRQIVEVFDSCSGGVRVDGDNCLGANVDEFIRNPNPITNYSIVSSFDWMAQDGSRYTTSYSLQFSALLVNFNPLGVYNFSGNLPRSIQKIIFPFKKIVLMDLDLQELDSE